MGIRIWPFKVSTEVFKAKSGAKLAELALQSRASVAGKSKGIRQENWNASQVGASGASATKELHFILDYIGFVEYVQKYNGRVIIDSADTRCCIMLCLS